MRRRAFLTGLLAAAAGTIAAAKLDGAASAPDPARAVVAINGVTTRYLEDRRTLAMASGVFKWNRIQPVPEVSYVDFAPPAEYFGGMKRWIEDGHIVVSDPAPMTSYADFGPLPIGPCDMSEASLRDRYEKFKAMNDGCYTLKIE